MSDDLLRSEEAPLHGYQGGRHAAPRATVPLAPSIAISREVGARGGDVARQLGAKTRWMVYDSELLGYSSQDPSAYDSVLADLPAEVGAWIEERMQLLHATGVLADDPAFERVSRLILALGAKGEAVFVGRGAGFLLPRETTLHVRLTAPLPDRIAYMSQWLRLPREEAAAQVTAREAKRTEFLDKCFHLPADGLIYDLVLNSSTLGSDLCADLIVMALRCKTAQNLTPLPESA